MPSELTMPKLSDSMADAVILRWLKSPGDAFAKGEALIEVETDKATVVYEAEADGTLGSILVSEGETASIGEPIATLANGDGRSDTPPDGQRAPGRAGGRCGVRAGRTRRRSPGAPPSSSASRSTGSPAPARPDGSRARTSSAWPPSPAPRHPLRPP